MIADMRDRKVGDYSCHLRIEMTEEEAGELLAALRRARALGAGSHWGVLDKLLAAMISAGVKL